MEFIELTKTTGKKIFININHIIFVEIGENEDNMWTHVIISHYGSVWVRETIEQVIEKIKEAKWQRKKKEF